MNTTRATHASVSTTCNTCHEKGLSFYMGAANPGLQGRPADHTSGTMATGDCSLCHTTANWNSNTLPAGHMPNPANQGCTVCHTAAPANYATMASIPVLHTGIANACATCHGVTQLTFYNNNDNPKSAVLSPPHIPILTGADCGACHAANFVSGGFGPMNMTQATHASVTGTCTTCHEKGLSFYMGAANPSLQGRPADHTSGQMVAPNDCSLCHTTANWNSNTLPAGHMPNPGNQGCAVCHTGAPSNYATLATNAVLHTGITSGCITCHGAPNATAPVFYLNYTPKAASGLSPPHIPTSTTSCESCHAIAFTNFSGTTMSSAKHTAMFAVIGHSCDGCHDASTLKFYGVTNLTTRPNGHHVGQDCSGCHNTNGWGGAAKGKSTAVAQTTVRAKVGMIITPRFSTPVRGGTLVLPGGRAGSGRSLAGSVASSAQPSHFGVTSNCISCHNGTLATGKGPAHIASNDACQNCHTTVAWLPARFDHRGVRASCLTCHNGALAPGKPAQHIQTAQDCGACHNTIDWSSVTFSHVGVSGTCQGCHNGITATGKRVGHVSTTQDCGICHNTLSWTITAPPKSLQPLIRGRRGAVGGPTGPQR
jgi:cytochrome c553